MPEAGVSVAAVGFDITAGLAVVSRCRCSMSVSLALVNIDGDLGFESDLEGFIPETG
jgi:hypothetical protein